MDDLEREALRRAEQMRSAFPVNTNIHTPSHKGDDEGDKREETNSQSTISPNAEASEKAVQRTKSKEKKDIFDFLLNNKDTTLILLLIFFLYEDNSDPMLIMALVYLLV